jgi:hypothetical protein
MTAKELLQSQMDAAGFGLEKAFEGLTDQAWDQTLGGMLSPRATLYHLCEVYTALMIKLDGGQFRWGTFQAPEGDPLTVFRDIRAQAVAKVLDSDSDAALATASDFITMHDNYHIGQLAGLRLSLEEGWNPYSIYP